jgi:hypothetical protein
VTGQSFAWAIVTVPGEVLTFGLAEAGGTTGALGLAGSRIGLHATATSATATALRGQTQRLTRV